VRLQSVRTRPQQSFVRPSVVWALDAFSKDFELHARTACAIRAHAPDCDIQPVYVLSEEVFSSRGYSSFLRAALKPRAYHNLLALLEHELLAEARKSGVLRSPRILVESTSDTSKCTGKLLRYAKRKRADAIAFGTHARSALSRFFAGSFAETLMRESPIPLLVAGPCQRRDLKCPKSLVVPTDFQRGDRDAFSELVRFASHRQLTLHLFHRPSTPMDDWASASMLGESWASVDTLFDLENAYEAKHWLKLATDAHVDTRLCAPNGRDSFCEALLEYAHQLDGASPMIAVLNATCAGLPARLTRDLIRTSPYPLFIAGHA
jgi:nucleotide-binding universal stress UspA family protein